MRALLLAVLLLAPALAAGGAAVAQPLVSGCYPAVTLPAGACVRAGQDENGEVQIVIEGRVQPPSLRRCATLTPEDAPAPLPPGETLCLP